MIRATASSASPILVPSGIQAIDTGDPPNPAAPSTRSGISRSASPTPSITLAVPRMDSAVLVRSWYWISPSIKPRGPALIRPLV